MSDYFIMDCAESRKNILYFPETKGYFTESHTDLLKNTLKWSASTKVQDNRYIGNG